MPAQKKPAVRWDEKFIVTAYQMAHEGETDRKIAEYLGVHEDNFHHWCAAHPGLRYALDQARNPPKNQHALQEYVYGVLPEHLQEVWDRIDFCHDSPSGYERAKALLGNRGDNALQHLFLYGLTKEHFDQAKVASMLGITPTKLKGWKQDDPEFAELLDYVHEAKGYFFEGHLVAKVAEGDTQAILHVNRTYNRDKYGDSVKVEKTVRGKVVHEHKHVHVNLGELKLSRECAEELMEKYLAKKREKENGVISTGAGAAQGALPPPDGSQGKAEARLQPPGQAAQGETQGGRSLGVGSADGCGEIGRAHV